MNLDKEASVQLSSTPSSPTRPSEKLKKWLHQYFSVDALGRDDLNYIFMAIQDNEDKLEAYSTPTRGAQIDRLSFEIEEALKAAYVAGREAAALPRLQQEGHEMTVPVQVVTLIEARNRIAKVMQATGISSRPTEADEALAALDIAIGQSRMRPVSAPAWQPIERFKKHVPLLTWVPSKRLVASVQRTDRGLEFLGGGLCFYDDATFAMLMPDPPVSAPAGASKEK